MVRQRTWQWITLMVMAVLCLYADLMTYIYSQRVLRDDIRLQQVVDDMLTVLQAQNRAGAQLNWSTRSYPLEP